MIYHIEDEKKKMDHRSRDDFSGYLSEEALMKLIGQVETKEMLHAPVHLKVNVLAQVRKERRAGRKRQVFVYRAKVLIAMAAALTVLILLPAGDAEDAGHTFLKGGTTAVSMEQAAIERQKSIDDKWERYMEECASGGISGFIEDINTRFTRFGEEPSKDGMKG